jgi:two-component system response regulator PilR (NtrC family)/two-component system response regulator HydG
VRGIEEDAIAALIKYAWPGNVRELSNAIEGAFTFGRSPMIPLQDLPAGVAGNRSAGRLAQSEGPMPQPESSIGTFAEAEREIIARALKNTDGNKVQAAALLRISRKKLYAKIEKYGL